MEGNRGVREARKEGREEQGGGWKRVRECRRMKQGERGNWKGKGKRKEEEKDKRDKNE